MKKTLLSFTKDVEALHAPMQKVFVPNLYFHGIRNL